MARHTVIFDPGDLTRAQKRRASARGDRPGRARASARHVHPEATGRCPEPAVPGPFGPGLTAGRVLEPREGRHPGASGDLAAHRRDLPVRRRLRARAPRPDPRGRPQRRRALALLPVGGVRRRDRARHVLAPTSSCSARTGPASPASIKTLVTRSIAFGHQVVVPSDPKGEWVAVAEAIPGGGVIRLGGGTGARLNPLDRGPRRVGRDPTSSTSRWCKQRRISTLIALVEMTLGGPAHRRRARRDPSTRSSGASPTPTTSPPSAACTSSSARLVGRDGCRLPRSRTAPCSRGSCCAGSSTATCPACSKTSRPSRSTQDAPIVVVDTSELFARGELVAQLTQVCTTAWIQAVDLATELPAAPATSSAKRAGAT